MESSTEKIKMELGKLRLIRFVCHFPWLMLIILSISILILPAEWKNNIVAVNQIFMAWSFFGFILSFFLHYFECPKCGAKFHFRQYGKGLLSGYMYNDFTRKCMHCGLRLNGSNI